MPYSVRLADQNAAGSGTAEIYAPADDDSSIRKVHTYTGSLL